MSEILRERPESVASQLHRRRSASQRLEALDSGCDDPWHRGDPAALGYEAAAEHLLALGLMPAPYLPALRAMWRSGGESRRVAQLVCARWELTA